MSGEKRPYHNAYANLAAAIIHSGEVQHDTKFLNSNWCDLLKEICVLDDKMYGGRGISTRGSISLYTSRKGVKDEHN